MAKTAEKPWTQGVSSMHRHWVHIPGLARGINAGTAARAALIVQSVNAQRELIDALARMIDDIESESFLFEGGCGVSEETLAQARAVLAKATGGVA